jgi:hypothetical protein
LLAIFELVEADNPYASISAISISAESKDVQNVVFSVAWPIWEDSSIVSSFLAKPVSDTMDLKERKAVTKGSKT